MDLDPGIQFVLSQLNQSSVSQSGDSSRPNLDEFRVIFDNISRLASGSVDSIRSVIDFELHLKGRSIKVREFIPEDCSRSAYGIFFHGGGFTHGSIESHHGVAAQLAVATRSRIYSIDYRLAPEFPFPAAVEDCIDATKAIIAMSDDNSKMPLFLAGDSAGGNLSLVTSIELNSESTEQVRAQLIFYPVVSFEERPSVERFGSGYFLTRDDLIYYRQNYLPEEDGLKDPRANVLMESRLNASPPTLIVSADHDPLIDEAYVLRESFDEVGVRVDHVVFEGVIHGFISMGAFTTKSKEALDLCASFLDEYLSTRSPQ
ncbi:MAG: alpha/beta hydrolase [Actinomycetota bacterium]|nr:alpha/beta hydrolase [Actinomycetota bacterium]